jgi:transcriptional regulator with XRE-family HTH domain
MSLAMRHSSRPQRGLGIAVRLTREKKKLTQETVAERAGIAVPTLSHLEAGHANPTWATVSDVAAALGVTVAELAKLAAKHES